MWAFAILPIIFLFVIGILPYYFIDTLFIDIINLLEIDGIYCSVTCNNNFSGHGMYQFSPEIFLSAFNEKYGMKILSLYLVRNPSPFEEWVDVNSYNGYRNETKFHSLDQTYIIVIAKKISDNRKNLIEEPPNQFNYENIDWK